MPNDMYVALIWSPELDLFNTLGVYRDLDIAQHDCQVDGHTLGQDVESWEQVTRAGEQTFMKAWESRPEPGSGRSIYYRVEQHQVRT